jgi:nucleoside transporter
LIAAGSSIIMGLYCFTLPHTPAPKKGEKVTVRDVLGLDALGLMKNRSFAVLVISSMLICIPLSFYYSFANLFLNNIGMENAAGKMTLGQGSEIFFMLLMPFFLKRFGFKKVLLIGMAAWGVRYVLFMYGNTSTLAWMLFGGILLHGICYDFFFVTGQIYVDKKAPLSVKGAAQGLITFATYGVGMFIGSWLSGVVVGAFTTQGPDGNSIYNWNDIWLVPAAASLVVLIVFTLLFKEEKEVTPEPVPKSVKEAYPTGKSI